MSDSSLGDEPKVMDINRPGKGRIMPTSSRPIVAPLVSGGVKDNDIKLEAPSSAHKVIEPLEDSGRNDDSDEDSNSQDLQEEAKDDVSESNESEVSEELDNSPQEEKTEALDDLSVGSAEVDALASNAAEKREAKQKAEAEAKKQEEVKAMIESKEFFVPISTAASDKVSKVVVIISLVIVAATLALIYLTVLS